jgi:hypothetical protein
MRIDLLRPGEIHLPMVRKLRVDVSGALSHVIVRGNRRAVISHDDADAMAFPERTCIQQGTSLGTPPT